MIPNEHSYCEIDPGAVDQWGIPVLRFHWKWSEHEIKQARHMHQTFVNIIEAMGGTYAGLKNPERESAGISVGGTAWADTPGLRLATSPGVRESTSSIMQRQAASPPAISIK